MYRTLDPGKITKTLEELGQRIFDRFPGSGLSRVAEDLIGLARQTSERIIEVSRVHWGLRLLLAAVIAGALTIVAMLAFMASSLKGSEQLSDAMQGLDASVNLAIVLGGLAFFVMTLETRWKRNRALTALHELRSIIHVIDMHQLPKDPSSDRPATVAVLQPGAPQRPISSFELMRYLDYCSEMLSLTAKLAALYAEKLRDPVIIDTVGDIERLTSNLSSKIWQKITLVQRLEGRDMPLPPASSFIPSSIAPAQPAPPPTQPVKPLSPV
jgi:hypothetical protein